MLRGPRRSAKDRPGATMNRCARKHASERSVKLAARSEACAPPPVGVGKKSNRRVDHADAHCEAKAARAPQPTAARNTGTHNARKTQCTMKG
eukprot:13056294-Alexandrium_andersonii.AAC.1